MDLKYKVYDDFISVRYPADFDPEKIFECGQCFRWNRDEGGAYTGVALGRVARIWREGCMVNISGGEEDFLRYWLAYFDMDRDYGAVRERLSVDNYMKAATEYGAGIRILRQDGWEALCSFILSQCNNIPRIKKMIETLCRQFGEPLEFDGGMYHTFPKPKVIAGLSVEDMAPLRCGFRAPYVIEAARAADSGRLDLKALAAGGFEDAMQAFKGLRGVGDKVASCAVLFGLGRLDAFPRDVWIKRAVARHYGAGFDHTVFGEYAGIAQQYMFYYARSEAERSATA